MHPKRRIAVFGSTGSIGKQTLDIISANSALFSVEVLTAQNSDDVLIEQARKFHPNIVVIGNDAKYTKVATALADLPIKVFAGEQSIIDVAALDCYDIMMAAIVGAAGLRPTLKAIEAGKIIGLANKETLVMAGDIMIASAVQHRARIIPVDSEHSAIFQCLLGEGNNPIETIILTASGGPFRGRKPNFLLNVRKEHALVNPNWVMGAKISIDSATMMNKGLEMIEAKWLFNVRPDQIKVIVHPQSIVHSMVSFEDGSIKAQMGVPDMRIPIQLAMSFPYRLKSNFPRCDFSKLATLSFEEPDIKTFRCLELAKIALQKGGGLPCVLNAANEIAVHAFLANKIGFLDIIEVVEHAMATVPTPEKLALEDYFAVDNLTRQVATEMITKKY